VIGKNKTCSSRWIISCTPLCDGVARDRLPEAEIGGQTPPPSSVVRPPLGVMLWCGRAHHLLLQWSRPSSRHWCVPACTHCCSALRTPSTGARCTTATSRCSSHCWWRTMSPHQRQAGTFNMLLHDDARATKVAR
jgi:hypothetical protein